MKVLKKHYEKIVLAGGAVALVGGAYLGMNSIGGASDFSKENDGSASGKSLSEVLKKEVKLAIDLIEQKHSLKSKKNPENEDQEFKLTSSIDFFGKKNSEEIIDLTDDSASSIHRNIPNKWFFDNGIGEQIGYVNALNLDFDKDGFTNLEEFTAKTKPNDIASHPPLLPKLKVEKVVTTNFTLSFTEISSTKISLKVEQKKSPILKHSFSIETGGTGPAKPPGNRKDLGVYENRFTLSKIVKGAGYNDTKIELIDRKSNDRVITFARKDKNYQVADNKAYLYLDALGKGSDEAKVVKEGDKFALPFGSKSKKYTVSSISNKEGNLSIVVVDDAGGQRELNL